MYLHQSLVANLWCAIVSSCFWFITRSHPGGAKFIVKSPAKTSGNWVDQRFSICAYMRSKYLECTLWLDQQGHPRYSERLSVQVCSQFRIDRNAAVQPVNRTLRLELRRSKHYFPECLSVIGDYVPSIYEELKLNWPIQRSESSKEAGQITINALKSWPSPAISLFIGH